MSRCSRVSVVSRVGASLFGVVYIGYTPSCTLACSSRLSIHNTDEPNEFDITPLAGDITRPDFTSSLDIMMSDCVIFGGVSMTTAGDQIMLSIKVLPRYVYKSDL